MPRRTLNARGLNPRALATGLALTVGAIGLLAVGCTRGSTSGKPPIHLNPNMDQQPKVLPQSASTFFYDGVSMRQPVPGTVARGELKADTAFFEGRDALGEWIATAPITVDAAVSERGAERYVIYCALCHGDEGAGNGMLVQRAGVAVADLHQQRLRDMSDGEMFDVITNGLGLMQGYRYPIKTADRWAIVAHVRELQSQRAASDAPADAATAGDGGDSAEPIPAPEFDATEEPVPVIEATEGTEPVVDAPDGSPSEESTE